MKKSENLHKGHRKRLIGTFMSGGKLTEIQTVELVLFFCFKQGDTNETAHRLLTRFNSVNELFFASEDEIASVKGMGKASAHKLRVILDTILEYRYLSDMRGRCDSWRYDSVCAYLTERIYPRLIRKDVGCVAVIFKNGLTADSFNLSDPDFHLLRAINKRKESGELSLLCIYEPKFGEFTFNNEKRLSLGDVGVDAVAVIFTCGKIQIELISPLSAE